MTQAKKYRKSCHYCSKPFMGRADSKYCSDSHRQLHYQSGKKISKYKALEDLLDVELSQIAGFDYKKIVKICMRCVKKIKKIDEQPPKHDFKPENSPNPAQTGNMTANERMEALQRLKQAKNGQKNMHNKSE